MVKKLLSFGTMFVLALVIAAPAHALSVDADTRVNGIIKVDPDAVPFTNNVNSNTEIKTGVAGPGTSVEGRGELNTGAGVNGGGDSVLGEPGRSEVGAESETDATTTLDENVEAPYRDTLIVRVNRGDIMSAPEEEVAADALISTAAQVETAADFEAFSRNIIRADEYVRSVEATDEEVSLTYKTRGKLLGFIPMNVGATVEVDAEGNVDVNYPWYRFLTSVEASDIEAEIESRIATYFEAETDNGTATSTATTTLDSNVEGTLTFEERAEIIDVIYDVLDSSLEVDVDAEASGDVNL